MRPNKFCIQIFGAIPDSPLHLPFMFKGLFAIDTYASNTIKSFGKKIQTALHRKKVLAEGEIKNKGFTPDFLYKNEVVAGAGIEPATRGFSVLCSTN